MSTAKSLIPKEVTKKVDALLQKVNNVVVKQQAITKKEEVILRQVTQEEKEDTVVEKEVEEVEQVSRFQEKIIGRLKHHKLVFPLLVGIGVVLVWRGLWGIFDVTPIISYSFISLVLGIVILWTINRINSL
ncbi:MAG TPA: hypothetical protein VLB73_00540 [Patescibacteria group bacterium]|nr:hypothetical protein [Patescibacteria group bacterium]